MQKRIESYNASYPLAYYSIGTIYSFYGHSLSTTNATAEQIAKYGAGIKELHVSSQEKAIKPVKGSVAPSINSKNSNSMMRFYAVVVEKISQPKPKIVVMFINDGDQGESYLTKQYAVGSGAALDGKDVMPISSHTSINGIQGSIPKVGGITRVGQETLNVGGITRADNAKESTLGVGGITRANPASNKTNLSHEDNQMQPTDRIGGITRTRPSTVQLGNVGGITRSKN